MSDLVSRRLTQRRGRGFTVIELLVVVSIVIVLIALAIPAIQTAREASQRLTCSDHLRQLAAAVHDYATEFTVLPPAATIRIAEDDESDSESWGVHGRLLQFLGSDGAAKRIDMSAPWQSQAALDGLNVAAFRCPTDPFNDRLFVVEESGIALYPSNYAFSYGTGFVFNPQSGESGDGLFLPNAAIKLPDVADGQSNTLMVSDVKSWQQYVIGGPQANMRPPGSVLEAEAMLTAVESVGENGHTLWPEGRVHQTGFTCALQPNSFVGRASGGESIDTDFTSWPEGKSGISGTPTFAAVTARSFHSGLVMVAMADGSVVPISELIDARIWKSLGTRAGGETVPGF